MTSDNNHFCILPWIHMHIWPDGTTFPCCLATQDYVIGNSNKEELIDIWNSPKMRLMRTNMLQDKPTSGCQKCYTQEAAGGESHRNAMNRDFKHHYDKVELTAADGSVETMSMIYMDIRFSNLCNMKCRTCFAGLSSQWHDDAVALGHKDADSPRILRFKESFIEGWSEIKNTMDEVEVIYFAGGEPLIMDEHYKILQYLIDNNKTDVKLFYNTNFSKLSFKKQSVIELWKHFPNVHLGASLDGMGMPGELIRAGTKWSDIESNRQTVAKDAPHVQFQLSCTVSVYNALHCFDFFDDWIAKGYVTPDKIDLNLLVDPVHSRVQILPIDIKNEIVQRIDAYLEKYNLKEVDVHGRAYSSMQAYRSYIMNEDLTHLIPEFLDTVQKLDTLRNEQIADYLPIINKLYASSHNK
tara:strand:- start:2724 stop:3953 length:1230 start_codon:yes stop_codon:yes gene_type:complete